MKKFFFLVYAICIGTMLWAQPIINSFTPKAAIPLSLITITGSGFTSNTDSNIVFFGAVKAKVLSATNTQLMVKVPIGASYSPISVTANGLIGFSKVYFIPTSPFSVSTIDSNSFESAFLLPSLYNVDKSVITAYDVDGNGKIDIAATDTSFTSTFSFFENTAVVDTINNQSFKPEFLFTNNNKLNAPYLFTDLDCDGKKDLAIVGYDNYPITIFKNKSDTGNIFFTDSIQIRVGRVGYFGSLALAAADFDNDGKTDLVTAADDRIGNATPLRF